MTTPLETCREIADEHLGFDAEDTREWTQEARHHRRRTVSMDRLKDALLAAYAAGQIDAICRPIEEYL